MATITACSAHRTAPVYQRLPPLTRMSHSAIADAGKSVKRAYTVGEKPKVPYMPAVVDVQFSIGQVNPARVSTDFLIAGIRAGIHVDEAALATDMNPIAAVYFVQFTHFRGALI